VVQELVDEEVAERLGPTIGHGIQKIRNHLAQVQEIADFELGYEQLQDMGLVFSLACARYIAERGHGYLKDQDNVWWEVLAGNWVRILPEN
jgi:glutamate mutase epsilon subunit